MGVLGSLLKALGANYKSGPQDEAGSETTLSTFDLESPCLEPKRLTKLAPLGRELNFLEAGEANLEPDKIWLAVNGVRLGCLPAPETVRARALLESGAGLGCRVVGHSGASGLRVRLVLRLRQGEGA